MSASSSSSSASSPWIFSRLGMVAGGSRLPRADSPIRIGILGAANIAPMALVAPSQSVPEVDVVAIAARDEEKAKAFAAKHKIPKHYGSYEALLQDPEIDAVYIPTPNSLHLKWTLASLNAGKHVLLEKPLASNEDEAREIQEAAAKTDLVVMEAFHYRYHPATLRLKEILQSGEIGELKSVLVKFYIPGVAFAKDDIRFNLGLAGGSLMDNGCYAINMMRLVIGEEPVECTHAECTPAPNACGLKDESQKKEVDATSVADFRFESQVTGRIESSLVGSLFGKLVPSLEVEGTKGSILFNNFVLPSVYHYITVKSEGTSRTEKHYADGNPTYYYQLKAFVNAVRNKAPFPTTVEEGVKNMRVIDMIYRKAGLTPRGKFEA